MRRELTIYSVRAVLYLMQADYQHIYFFLNGNFRALLVHFPNFYEVCCRVPVRIRVFLRGRECGCEASSSNGVCTVSKAYTCNTELTHRQTHCRQLVLLNMWGPPLRKQSCCHLSLSMRGVSPRSTSVPPPMCRPRNGTCRYHPTLGPKTLSAMGANPKGSSCIDRDQLEGWCAGRGDPMYFHKRPTVNAIIAITGHQMSGLPSCGGRLTGVSIATSSRRWCHMHPCLCLGK